MKTWILALALTVQGTYLYLLFASPGSFRGSPHETWRSGETGSNRLTKLEPHKDTNLEALLRFEESLEKPETPPLSPGPASNMLATKRNRKLAPASIKLEEKLTSPDFLKAEWGRKRLATWKEYAQFFSLNKVPADAIPKFVDMIADANMGSEVMRTLAKISGDSTAAPLALEVDAHEKLMDALGSDLYERLNAYSMSIPVRRKVQQYSDLITAMGYELSREEQESLVKTISVGSGPGRASGGKNADAIYKVLSRSIPASDATQIQRVIAEQERP